jgi:aspartate/methionine/tyrosine aminotransferase
MVQLKVFNRRNIMHLSDFKLENYFAEYEFTAPYMMSGSDAETHSLQELLSLADETSLNQWNNLKLCYTEVSGNPSLREEIAKLYQSVTAENILVFTGAGEPIFIFMNIILKPTDHVLVITPCYQSLIEVPKALGADVTACPLAIDNNMWTLDLDQFKKSVQKNTKLIIINFPHNPTSYHPDLKTYQEIINIAKDCNAYLFSDEVYRFSEHDPKYLLPAAVDCYEKALSLGVISKSFGLPGLRIGWLSAQDKTLLKEINNFKNYTTLCNSAPSEILSMIALKAKEKILSRNNAIILQNLTKLQTFFTKWENLFAWYCPTRAGMTAFPQLKTITSIDQFAKKLVDETGVLILPGSTYDYPGNYFRIGFGRKNLSEALARFDSFLEKHSRNL